MTLLELRKKIDYAIAKYGGQTKVAVKDDDGSWAEVQSVYASARRGNPPILFLSALDPVDLMLGADDEMF